jgi:hypothetical protein
VRLEHDVIHLLVALDVPAEKLFVKLSRFLTVSGGDFDVNNIPFAHDSLLNE